MRDHDTLLGAGLIGLGAGVAVCSLLGPFVLEVIDYRTSATSLHQIVGSDAATLLLVAPSSVILGLLVLAGRPGAALLGLAPAVFTAYTYTQLIVGNEYGTRPGNVERFFPLLLAVFVLALAVAIGAWTASSSVPLPEATPRADRVAEDDNTWRRRRRRPCCCALYWLGWSCYVVATKGALDGLLRVSSRLLSDGHPVPLDAAWQGRVLAAHDSLASDGMRVLGVSVRALDHPPDLTELPELEQNLVLLASSA